MRPAEIDSYDEYLVAGRPPRKRFPIRTTIAGVVLFLGGIIFLAVGLSIMFSSTRSHGKDRGTLLVILGSAVMPVSSSMGLSKVGQGMTILSFPPMMTSE
eukprot:scaffold6852_cov215-Ochromonas_danica.AAC.20